jgi:hypothetical protein
MSQADDKPCWEDLATLLRWAAALFGEPASLHHDRLVERSRGLALRGWLRGLEAIARALLLMAAAALTRPAPARSRAPRAAPPARDAGDPSTDDGAADPSERWAGVAFRLAPPASRASLGRDRWPPAPLIRTAPLAVRFEALIRVAEAPGRYVRRMSRRLHAAPSLARLAARILRWPGTRDDEGPPRDDIARAQAHAWLALEALEPAPP